MTKLTDSTATHGGPATTAATATGLTTVHGDGNSQVLVQIKSLGG